MANDRQRAWVERALGVRLSTGDAPAGKIDLDIALQAWQTARAGVVTQLRGLSKEIEATGDPESVPAIILVQAIVKNLTLKPSTPRSIDELERYLTTDSIIDEAEGPNGLGIDVAIKAPLLPILRTLRASMPAQ
jgi:hypothetical protein